MKNLSDYLTEALLPGRVQTSKPSGENLFEGKSKISSKHLLRLLYSPDNLLLERARIFKEISEDPSLLSGNKE
jgi:hypothetical protein